MLAAALFGFLNCHKRATRVLSKIDFFSELAKWPRIDLRGQVGWIFRRTRRV